MPLKIQTPFIGQALQKLFGLQGRVSPVLEEFIVPVVLVGALEEASEPPVIRQASSIADVGGTAAQFGTVRIETPGGTLLRIDRMIMMAAAAGDWFMRPGSSLAAPSTTEPKRFTDGRLLEQAQEPAGVVTSQTLAGSLAPVWRYRVDPALQVVSIYEPRAWIVGSGVPDQFGFMEFQFSVANVAVNLTLEWTEYQFI